MAMVLALHHTPTRKPQDKKITAVVEGGIQFLTIIYFDFLDTLVWRCTILLKLNVSFLVIFIYLKDKKSF